MGKCKDFKSNKSNREIIDKYILEYKAKRSGDGDISHSTRSIEYILRKLSDFLENNTTHKSLKKASKQELIDFFNNNIYVTKGSHNITGSRLLPFYRYIYNLDKHSRPPNLLWYETSNKRSKRKLRDPKRKENLLITPEEYKTMIEYSNDFYGQNKGLWETYYLSGFRPEEVQSMNIEDVEEDPKSNIVSISCPKSKTRPRTIQLTEYPDNLIRYVGNHPHRNNKKAPLWFQLKGSSKLNRLSMLGIERRFREMRNDTNIKDTLVIKSFRKTRFCILSNIRNDDGYCLWDNGKLFDYFGWEDESAVEKLRKYYDLRKSKQIEKIILSGRKLVSKSYDTIVKEKEQIEKKFLPVIKKLEKENKELKNYTEELDKRVNLAREDIIISKKQTKILLDQILTMMIETIPYLNENERHKISKKMDISLNDYSKKLGLIEDEIP